MNEFMKYRYIGVILIIVVSIVLIMVLLKSSKNQPVYRCKDGKHYVAKCDDCYDDDTYKKYTSCPHTLQWDCGSKKCKCHSPLKQCGSKCCPVCDTTTKTCCPDSRTIKSAQGTYECCGAGSKASSDKKHCVPECGDGVCDLGEECVSVTDLSKISYENLLKSLKAHKMTITTQSPPKGSVKGIIKFCAKESKGCVWGNIKNVPSVVDNFQPYFNWDGIDDTKLCFPKQIGNDPECFSLTEANCSSKCVWRDVFEYFTEKPDEVEKHLIDLQKHEASNNSDLGNYCAPGGKSQIFTKLSSTLGNEYCTIYDCIKRVSSEGTSQIKFDDKHCSALTNLNEGGINLPKIYCNDNGVPCKECKKSGTYIDRGKCTRDEFKSCGKEPTKPWDDKSGEGNCPSFSESNIVCGKNGQLYHPSQTANCGVNGECVDVMDPENPGEYPSRTACEAAQQKAKNICKNKLCYEVIGNNNRCECTKRTDGPCGTQARGCFDNNPKNCDIGTVLNSGERCYCNWGTYATKEGSSHGCKNSLGGWWGDIKCKNQYGDPDNSLLRKYYCPPDPIIHSADEQGWGCNCHNDNAKGGCTVDPPS